MERRDYTGVSGTWLGIYVSAGRITDAHRIQLGVAKAVATGDSNGNIAFDNGRIFLPFNPKDLYESVHDYFASSTQDETQEVHATAMILFGLTTLDENSRFDFAIADPTTRARLQELVKEYSRPVVSRELDSWPRSHVSAL